MVGAGRLRVNDAQDIPYENGGMKGPAPWLVWGRFGQP